MENLYKYIYNIDQANYFIKNGVTCCGVNIHHTTKNVFLVFKNDTKFQIAFDKWNNID